MGVVPKKLKVFPRIMKRYQENQASPNLLDSHSTSFISYAMVKEKKKKSMWFTITTSNNSFYMFLELLVFPHLEGCFFL